MKNLTTNKIPRTYLFFCSFFIVTLFSESTFSQPYFGENNISDLSTISEKLRGKVKQVSSITYNEVKKAEAYNFIEFDRRGKVVMKKMSEDSSSIREHLDSYLRDDSGNLLKLEVIWTDSDQFVPFIGKYMQGKLIESTEIAPEQHYPLKTIFKYNSFGARERLDIFKIPTLERQFYVIFEYDSKNRVKTIQHFNNDGQLTIRETFEVNNLGKQIQHIVEECKLQCARIAKTVYKYDGIGRKIRLRKYYGNDLLQEEQSYSYSNSGLLRHSAIIDYASENPTKIIENFNSLGEVYFVAERHLKDRLMSTKQYLYVFDKFNNWIEKKEIFCKSNNKKDCKLVWRTKRKITYF